ncbi:MAG: RluA family pseudouridine synthase [Candidatus Omnitrophica bacterium]|nr:RluA family pseudouridine synthase [Candidatus Omnitrophota bacterium]
MSIETVFEDEYLKIVNKPSKMLTIPARGKKKDLTSILNANLKKEGFTFRLHPCHRLDYSTSGLIIYAKGKSIQKKMMRLFKENKVEKSYIAFVHGKVFPIRGKIDVPIENKTAITYYSLIEQRKEFAILKVNPFTGRKNQIRIHFKRIGNPIVGEDRFAFRKDFHIKAKRLCLHAEGLKFIHPITQRYIKIKSHLPLDMQIFLEKHPE